MKMLNMRAERLKRGWTQVYVAKMVGSSKSSILRIETGQYNAPYQLMCRLEDLFGMTHRELFKEVEYEELD